MVIKDKLKRRRIHAFFYCLVTLGSVYFLLNGTVYELCEVAKQYLFIIVGVLHLLLIVASVVYFWYTHKQCMKHGVSDRLEF